MMDGFQLQPELGKSKLIPCEAHLVAPRVYESSVFYGISLVKMIEVIRENPWKTKDWMQEVNQTLPCMRPGSPGCK